MTKSPTSLIKEIEQELTKVKSELIGVNYEIKALQEKAKELEKSLIKIEDGAISKDRYTMVEKIVFGLVGLAITGMATAIINGALK